MQAPLLEAPRMAFFFLEKGLLMQKIGRIIASA
jgi:hypothetical protein